MTAAEVGRTGGHVLARQVFRAELDSLAASGASSKSTPRRSCSMRIGPIATSSVSPPEARMTQSSDLRGDDSPCRMHGPGTHALPWRKEGEETVGGEQKGSDEVIRVDYHGKIGKAPEGVTGGASLVDVGDRDAHGRSASAWVSRTSLHRDTHALVGGGVICDQINAGVINPSALEAVPGQPVENECLPEVAGDLCVSRALEHFHWATSL